MKFNETEKEPEFTLTMNLQDAIDLWRIVSSAKDIGHSHADKFVETLHDFAANSNEYGHLKWR